MTGLSHQRARDLRESLLKEITDLDSFSRVVGRLHHSSPFFESTHMPLSMHCMLCFGLLAFCVFLFWWDFLVSFVSGFIGWDVLFVNFVVGCVCVFPFLGGG